jgi:hypothetical protein
MLNVAQMSWETTRDDDDFAAVGLDAVVTSPAAASSLSMSTKLVRGSPERVCALGDACWPRLSTIPRWQIQPRDSPLPTHSGTVQLRGRRLALVIGVCRYEDLSLVDLPACQRDAERMAELLAGFGYTVDVLLNATRAQIEEGTCARMRDPPPTGSQ